MESSKSSMNSEWVGRARVVLRERETECGVRSGSDGLGKGKGFSE